MARDVVGVGGVVTLAGAFAAVVGAGLPAGAETYFAVSEWASVTSGGIDRDDLSTAPFVSADGDSVVFLSDATNLVRGDANAKRDAFLRRRSTAACAVLTPAGRPRPARRACVATRGRGPGGGGRAPPHRSAGS